MNDTTNTLLPPYPRIGEIYRALALAFDTKSKNREVDRLAREGDYDWSLPQKLIDELFYKPLCSLADEEFAGFIRQSLIYLHEDYVHLFSTIGLDSLIRSEALPLLIENYFAPHGAALIYQAKECFGGPDLMQMLQPDQNLIETVFEWATPGNSLDLAKIAFPDTTGSDKTSREMVIRWIQGTHLPDSSSFKLFLGSLERNSTAEHKEKITDLKRWLLVARAIQWFEREAPECEIRSVMWKHALSGFPEWDVGKVLSQAVCDAADRIEQLKLPGLMLSENLNSTQPKTEGDQELRKIDLDEYENLVNEFDPEGRTRYWLAWFRGRWEVLSGNYDAALPYYEEAVSLANYRAGKSQREILQEALVLAGLLEDRPLLKRLKHRAIAFGLLVPPRDQDTNIVEDWEIDHLRTRFLTVFPNEARFSETGEESTVSNRLSFLLFATEEMDKRVPDLRNPDRTVTLRLPDGQERRWTQLRLFASFGRTDAVQVLLEKGADVDKLDDHGGAALLCAIQHATQTGDRSILDLLLAVSHKPETINSLTKKRQISALFEAIDYGEPDVVARLLEMGAEPDMRGNIVGETPLYHCMEILGRIRYPARTYRHLYDSLYNDWDLVQCEVMRRYGVQFAGVFGEQAGLTERLANPRNLQIYKELVSVTVEMMRKRHSIPKLCPIVELLLSKGANPNAAHHYPTPGRTPLMLAAENNSGWAFDLLLRHAGDPYQKDCMGMDCAQIAMGFHAAEVIGYLRSKGII